MPPPSRSPSPPLPPKPHVCVVDDDAMVRTSLQMLLEVLGMRVSTYADAAAFIQRLLPLVSMHWFDEIVEMCFAALVFYGAALLWTTKGHFCVGDWISPRLSGERARAWYRVLVAALCVAFQAVFIGGALAMAEPA